MKILVSSPSPTRGTPRYRFLVIPLGVLLGVGTVPGCLHSPASTRQPGPVEQPAITPDTFLAPYKTGLARLEGPDFDMARQPLVQLGLPSESTVLIWYATPEKATGLSGLRLEQLTEDGRTQPVPSANIHHLTNLTHGTGRIEIRGLAPGVTHRFRLSGGPLPAPVEVTAATKPAKAAPFSFLAGSCFQPWRSDQGHTFIADETAAILQALRDRAQAGMKTGTGPAFYLGLGDQFYVDPGANHHASIAYLHGSRSEQLRGSIATAPEVLRGLYRYHLGLRPINEALAALPSAMMWDDHDIRDGWGSQDDENDPRWLSYYASAREAFLAFQAARNPYFGERERTGAWETGGGVPPVSQPAGELPRENGEMHFTFDWGAASFFVVDGRSDRNFHAGRGISPSQRRAVQLWLETLSRAGDIPKVFVFCTPVPLAGGLAVPGKLAAKVISEGRDDARERAYNIKEERDELLKSLYAHARKHPRHRLLILSGDVHYSGIQVLRDIRTQAILGYEIVSSGLAQTDFNSLGPFWLTKATYEHGVFVENHGFYAGPSFAELFISPLGDTEPPEVRVLFYPGAERPVKKSRLKEFVTLRLNVENLKPAFAHPPEDYPINERIFSWIPWNVNTRSKLADYLILDQWISSGRARKEGPPTDPAFRW